jgi:hypothetical protein
MPSELAETFPEMEAVVTPCACKPIAAANTKTTNSSFLVMILSG